MQSCASNNSPRAAYGEELGLAKASTEAVEGIEIQNPMYFERNPKLATTIAPKDAEFRKRARIGRLASPWKEVSVGTSWWTLWCEMRSSSAPWHNVPPNSCRRRSAPRIGALDTFTK